jgi:hypothetical protein
MVIMWRDFVPRPKDVHAGSLVIKIRGKKKYVYLVYRVGKKVLSVYLGSYYDESVLCQFIEYHRERIQRLEAKLAVHRHHLELAEKELARMQNVKSSLNDTGLLYPTNEDST